MGAQVIAPEEWVQGLDNMRLLPNRYTVGLFTGNIQGVNQNTANNVAATRVWDIQGTDYITDYDDRRLNGHGNVVGASGFNADGKDGWGASAYGVFQDVRFDSRVYTMGRHRSVAFRIFDEMQYAGAIGEWGTSTTSNVSGHGNALMQTAALIAKARDLWEKEILGPDIDKYNLFAVMNGHISGRWVQTNPDQVFSDDGTWVAQPGAVEGQAIPPHFAPIHCIEWDDENIPLLLQTIKVTWNNLFIPQDNRVIMIDPMYEYPLLMALTGKGVPATESAYSDIQNGSFTKLMGWEFNFEIPSSYWPRLYVDENLNVVHSADGSAAYDMYLRSINHDDDGDKKLMLELVDADRMNRPNYIRTVWDATDGVFKKIVTNYPLGMPAATDYFGNAIEIADNTADADDLYNYSGDLDYPWVAPGAGYGLPVDAESGEFPDGETAGPAGQITRVQTIGVAVWRKAAQLSQEFSSMVTAEGGTRGKFTECCMDVKYDAWVIEGYSHGILPIIDVQPNTGVFAIPVKVIGLTEDEPAEGEGDGEGDGD